MGFIIPLIEMADPGWGLDHQGFDFKGNTNLVCVCHLPLTPSPLATAIWTRDLTQLANYVK